MGSSPTPLGQGHFPHPLAVVWVWWGVHQGLGSRAKPWLLLVAGEACPLRGGHTSPMDWKSCRLISPTPICSPSNSESETGRGCATGTPCAWSSRLVPSVLSPARCFQAPGSAVGHVSACEAQVFPPLLCISLTSGETVATEKL